MTVCLKDAEIRTICLKDAEIRALCLKDAEMRTVYLKDGETRTICLKNAKTRKVHLKDKQHKVKETATSKPVSIKEEGPHRLLLDLEHRTMCCTGHPVCCKKPSHRNLFSGRTSL